MELKRQSEKFRNDVLQAFNQTRMELKQVMRGGLPIKQTTFNQTRMELKPGKVWTITQVKTPFNQTRMELKHNNRFQTVNQFKLLIRPEWN